MSGWRSRGEQQPHNIQGDFAGCGIGVVGAGVLGSFAEVAATDCGGAGAPGPSTFSSARE